MMRYFKCTSILLLLLFILFPKRTISDTKYFISNGLDLFNVNETINHNGKSIFSISDITYKSDPAPHITDLVLSLNSSSSHLSKDDTNKYQVSYASYKKVSGNGVLGGGGAHFFKHNHRIEISTERNLWMGNATDLGSFTLEFRFNPSSIKDNSILFSRIGYASRIKNGIEIVFKHGKVEARLYSIFTNKTGRKVDVILRKGIMIKTGSWYHFMLSFDRISGKLAKYLNGREDDVAFISENEEPFNGVFHPSFSDDELPLTFIGKKYTGYIDELRITHRHIQDLKKETEIALSTYKRLGIIGRNPINREGVITSPVYTFPFTGTKVIIFSWDEKIRKNTFIWFEFRISDNLFDRSNGTYKWYRIVNNQRNIYLKKINNEFLRGKYYQWRAHLIASPDGKQSPLLYNIRMDYQLDPPPRAPGHPEVTKTDDTIVRLKWKKNREHDIFGYNIYYGNRSGKYDGILGTIKNNLITNKNNGSSNYIEVTITNREIENNKLLDKRNILVYPHLKNNVLYFFAISAYDSYKPNSKYNHESDLSREVTARPFAGSEIDKK